MRNQSLISSRRAAFLLGKSVSQVNRDAAGGRLEYAQKLEGRTGDYLFDLEVVLAGRPAEQLQMDAS